MNWFFFQEWEEKAAEDKKRYDVEYKKWFEAGGEAAIKAAKKGGAGDGFKSKEFIANSNGSSSGSSKAGSGSDSGSKKQKKRRRQEI